MKFTHLGLILGAVAVIASPVRKQGDSIEVSTEDREKYAFANRAQAAADDPASEKFATFEGTLKTTTLRGPAPTAPPTLEWDLDADAMDDETFGADDMDAGDDDDVDEDGKKKKKKKKPKKPKKPKKTRKTKTVTETKTETTSMCPLAPIMKFESASDI